jgi:hypothetical protein
VTSPPLAIEQADGSRAYVHPLTGEKVPSVTTIISAGIPRPLLVGWAARKAAEHAVANWSSLAELPPGERLEQIRYAHERFAQEKADIGNEVHNLIDCWGSGRPLAATPKEISGYVNSFIDFMLDKRPKFLFNEVTLWSREHEYAGTADFIAEIDGKVCLGDCKTGRRVYDEVGLQLSALRHADFIISPDGEEAGMPPIDFTAALHVRPRSWKFIPVVHDAENFATFLACRQVYRWTHEVAPSVLEAA